MGKFESYNAITNPQQNVVLVIDDVNDTTMSPLGTTKKITLGNLLGSVGAAVNVISKGADPTGVADSTSAFQAAINALGATGGMVWIPPGTYKITPVSATVPALTVPSNVMLAGAGMNASTLLKNANGPLIDFSGAGPISKTNNWNKYQGLRDLAINGNGMTGLVLRLYYVQFYYEYNVSIYGNADVAVDMVQCYDSRIFNGLYQFGGSTAASTISGGQAVTHLIRNSAAPATTLSAAVSGTITALPVAALPAALPAGIVQVWSASGAVQNFVTTGAAASATSIPVSSTAVTITTAIGNTVNGFGWSGDSTNALSMHGCHWENNLSGAIWITAGVNNTANVNNIHIIDSKCEQDAIGFNCPQIQVDASTNSIQIDHLYCYVGAFNGGFSTPVTGIYFHPGYGTLSNVDMGNGGVACVSNGIDAAQTALRVAVENVNQWWNTSPTVAGVNCTAATVNLRNIQIGGTVTTPIAGSGNYSVVNDNAGNWNDVGSLVAGQTTAFGGFIPAGVTGAVQASRYAGATSSGAPASGTFAVGDFVVAQNGHMWICTTAGSPGTWTDAGGGGVTLDTTASDIQPDGVQAAGSVGKAAEADHVHPAKSWQSNLLMPSGAIAEDFPRLLAQSSLSLSSGTVQVTAIPLAKGTVVTNITLCTGTFGESGGSHGWYALLDSTGKVLAVTADQTTNTWSANASLTTLAMGSPYTVTTAGVYYLAVSITATTLPGIMGFTNSAGQATGRTPVLAGTAGTQNAPPAVNAVLTITSGTTFVWGYVS